MQEEYQNLRSSLRSWKNVKHWGIFLFSLAIGGGIIVFRDLRSADTFLFWEFGEAETERLRAYFVLALCMLFGVSVALGQFGEKFQQKARDRFANFIFRLLSDGRIDESFSFGLYLRSFTYDAKFKFRKKSTKWDGSPSDRIIFNDGDALERRLADALENHFPLIGLGNSPHEIAGVGHAGFVEEWQRTVKLAINASKAIFIVPSASNGALWEIGEIDNAQCLEKTIFIMPPLQNLGTSKDVLEFLDSWVEIKKIIELETGIVLPDYKGKGGALFRYTEGKVSPKIAWLKFEPEKISSAVKKLDFSL